jgi:hypothetical protein
MFGPNPNLVWEGRGLQKTADGSPAQTQTIVSEAMSAKGCRLLKAKEDLKVFVVTGAPRVCEVSDHAGGRHTTMPGISIRHPSWFNRSPKREKDAFGNVHNHEKPRHA